LLFKENIKNKKGENMIDKTLFWITFIWLIFCIIYFGRKWIKERKVNMQISEEGMKKYRGKHFNGRFYW
jgi:preprotein translocase subunit SecG